MRENLSFQSPVLFFISRLLILLGMVVFFYSIFSIAGILLYKPLFGIDVLSDLSVLSNYTANPNALRAAKFLQVFISIGAFIIPAWFFPKALQQYPQSFLRVNAGFGIRDLGLGLGLMIISSPLISWLIYVNQNVHLPESMSALESRLKAAEDAAAQLTDAFTRTDSVGGLLVNIFVVALVPAICEELLFRGALLQFVRICFKNKHAAVWSSAIIFSAFHMQFFGFLPRLTLGVFLGYMFVYSRSIWVPVIAHFYNNLLALFASYFKWNEGAVDILKEDYVFPAYITILSFVLCAGILWLMHRYEKNEEITDAE
jgi:membrane protease YdiL (CAAX protease family)